MSETDRPMDEYLALEERIAGLIERGAEAEFGDAALAAHRFQRAHNEPFDRYCHHLGVPAEIADWRSVPAVPQSAFKRFALRAFPADQTVRTFRTSGTTGEGFGEHHFRSLRLYDASILRGWDALAMPCATFLILTPTPEAAPHSSLAHMMGVLARQRGAARPTFLLDPDGRLDADGFREAMESCVCDALPVGLLGTALAFLNLFEGIGSHRAVLPAGSFAMETGGYKGCGRDIAKAALYAKFAAHFDLAPERVLNEYGMTELSSQCYTRGLGALHTAPPWMRALVIDPETDREVAVGETGVLRLVDLANLGSVLAIQTQDLAVRRERGFELLGRDPAALPRGCSRAADERLRA